MFTTSFSTVEVRINIELKFNLTFYKLFDIQLCIHKYLFREFPRKHHIKLQMFILLNGSKDHAWLPKQLPGTPSKLIIT